MTHLLDRALPLVAALACFSPLVPAQDPRDPRAWGDIHCRPLLPGSTISFLQVGTDPGFPEPPPSVCNYNGALWVSDAPSAAVEIARRLYVNSYGRLDALSFTPNMTVEATPKIVVSQDPCGYRVGHPGPQDSIGNLYEEMRYSPQFPVSSDYRVAFIDKDVWGGNGGVATFGAVMGATSSKYGTWPMQLNQKAADNILHETGHSLLLGHSNFSHAQWECCPEGPESPGMTCEPMVTGPCADAPENAFTLRGDLMAVMGGMRPGEITGDRHFNPFFKYLLGMLENDEIFWLPSDGTHTVQLHAIEQSPDVAPASSYAAAVIPRSPTESYWIFYRASEPSTLPGIVEGPIVILTGESASGPTALLYDMRPQSASGSTANLDWRDAALPPDAIFESRDFTMRNLGTSGSTVAIEIAVKPGVSLANMDAGPVIQLLSPVIGTAIDASDHTVASPFVYEVNVFDPDVGSSRGDGIASVQLSLYRSYPENEEPPIVIGTPYTEWIPGDVPRFTLDVNPVESETASIAGRLLEKQYTYDLRIDVETTNGVERSVSYRHWWMP